MVAGRLTASYMIRHIRPRATKHDAVALSPRNMMPVGASRLIASESDRALPAKRKTVTLPNKFRLEAYCRHADCADTRISMLRANPHALNARDIRWSSREQMPRFCGALQQSDIARAHDPGAQTTAGTGLARAQSVAQGEICCSAGLACKASNKQTRNTDTNESRRSCSWTVTERCPTLE